MVLAVCRGSALPLYTWMPEPPSERAHCGLSGPPRPATACKATARAQRGPPARQAAMYSGKPSIYNMVIAPQTAADANEH